MKKALFTIVISILPALAGAQASLGAFYDLNTNQVGQQLRYEAEIIFPTTLNIGFRHQPGIAVVDTTIGGMIGDDDFWVSSSIGTAFYLSTVDGGNPSGTGILALYKSISYGFGILAQYQVTRNNNVFPEPWQHQLSTGIYIELLPTTK